ncbi:MAG: hypothetical protein KAI15_01315 [Gammaproteobacteria bacterium]|nr:hypothetical protein [Gammaproteobacteria bacterium]
MKYVLLIVFVLIIGTIAFVFGWFGGDSQTVVVKAPVVETEVVNEVNDEDTVAEEERYAAILAEYKKLEKARRNLDRRLARIKAVMWNVELPAEQAKEIVGKIRKGYELLKTKKLLGAFSGLQSISDELARVEYAHENLEGVVEEIKAAKSEN